MSKLLIASGSGELFLYNNIDGEISTVFTNPNPNEWFMGLTKYKDCMVVSSTLGIHIFGWQGKELNCLCSIANTKVINPRFQHIRTIGNLILATTPTSNSIFIMEIKNRNELRTFGTVRIARTAEQTYFDQICGVGFAQDKIYVLFHSLANDPTTSRLLEFDNSFKLIKSRDFGWSAFGLSLYQGDKYVICNHNKKFSQGGLVKNTKLRFQWKSEFTMMDMAMTKDSIFLVGSTIVKDGNTTLSGGVIIELDHEYHTKNIQMFRGFGQFRGCMIVDEEDLTNNTDQLDSSILNIKKRNDENIVVTVFGKGDSNGEV